MSEAEDRDAIRQLITNYAINGDRGRVDLLLHSFTEDAEMLTPAWRALGRAGIGQAMGWSGKTEIVKAQRPAEGGAGRVLLRHHLTSSHITFDSADEASGRTYWINFNENGPDHAGLYVDKYRRIDGKWLIVFREVRVDWKAPSSRAGLVGPRPADAPPLRLYTGQ